MIVWSEEFNGEIRNVNIFVAYEGFDMLATEVSVAINA
jgi:hypothetical protein